MDTIARIYHDLNNYNEALIWYKKSAELGYFEAQLTLGKIYLEGKIVNKSLERSAYWVKTAFENLKYVDVENQMTNKYRAEERGMKPGLWKY